MDARPRHRRSDHANKVRGGGVLGPEAQTFHSPSTRTRVFGCKRMHVHVDTQTHSWASAASSQRANILLGCAPISRINEEVSRFTLQQHVGLWGLKGYSLQFVKSVFSNQITFKLEDCVVKGNLQNFVAQLGYVHNKNLTCYVHFFYRQWTLLITFCVNTILPMSCSCVIRQKIPTDGIHYHLKWFVKRM